MIRVATYHRVSTLDQNPALARRELRAAAGRLGKLDLEVEEVGSGACNDRPGWQKVLSAARHGQVDQVVVWKLDRAGRSTLDLLANIEALQAAGVRFTAVTQGLDIRPAGDSMSRLLLTCWQGSRSSSGTSSGSGPGSAWPTRGGAGSASASAPSWRPTR